MHRPILPIVLGLCCACGPFTGRSQEAPDTSYLTTYYVQKVTQFRLQPDGAGEVVFLGDSITDIGEWAELWKNARVRNRGISSDNTFGVLARLDEVLSSRPRKIFIMIGINDIARGTPDSVILSNYRRIVERIRSASSKTEIYIESVLPTNSAFTEFPRHQNKGAHILTLNTALRNLAADTHSVYVDLYSVLSDGEGRLDPRYTNDGLHLTGAGYQRWKELLVQHGYMK